MSDDVPDKPASAPEDPTRVMTRRPDGSAPAPAPAPVDEGATQIAPAVRSAPAPTSAPNGGSSEAGVLPPGSRVAEFEVTSLVGQGGFGAVYEAWDHTLERVVAIKEYLPVSLSTRQFDGTVVPLSERTRETFDLGMRSFINEARLLAQFDHPSLLKVYRFWQERGTTYMVMPFYRGDTLRQALAAIPGGVDEGWLLRIMDGVTQALAVMHGANCYHRDIAPDNIILLEGSGRPVVLDFGAARRVITDKTQAITVILKPGYAPIEQYAEMPDMSQGAWTDVYALAAVMHVAVSGRAPPPSVARLLSDSYSPLANNEVLRQRYSLQLLSAIDAGLGVRPESRPQSMAELRAMLGLEGAQTVIPVRTAPVTTPMTGSKAASLPPPPPTPAGRARSAAWPRRRSNGWSNRARAWATSSPSSAPASARPPTRSAWNSSNASPPKRPRTSSSSPRSTAWKRRCSTCPPTSCTACAARA